MTNGHQFDQMIRQMKVIRAEIPPVTILPSEDASTVLNRLVAEWRLVRAKLGISTSATVLDVAARLNVDRGTAQRLNRISKLADLTPDTIELFPGVRAWNQILSGVEKVLGAQHPNYQTLSLACDHFNAWISSMGGSRSAAIRQTTAGQASVTSNISSNLPQDSARARWVDACAEVFGYLMQIRFHSQLIRQSPLALASPRLDVASLEVLKDCRGKVGSMPLAFSRATFKPNHDVEEALGGENARSFYILRSLTSKPAPATLSTGDTKRQTVFVEPQWASLTESLNLALLHEERAAMGHAWGTADEWFEFATINRHPCRNLIIERVVCKDIASQSDVALRVFRSHTMMAHEEPWFERIPEESPILRIGTLIQAMNYEAFDGYAAVMTETIEKLKWDPDDLIVYRASIENPIPLATYTVMFDKVRA